MSRIKQRSGPAVYSIVFLALVLTLIAPFFGSSTFTGSSSADGLPSGILSSFWTEVGRDIFWRLRVPRVLLGFLAGAALALSGMTFQALFRNPLATPYTLGVATGAAFGASLYIRFGVPFVAAGISGTSIFALIGALTAISLVYGVSKSRGDFSTPTMLLAGVAMSFFFSSLMMLMQYLSDFTESFRVVRWLMGGLETVGYEAVFRVLPFVGIGSVVILRLRQELNLISLGEDIAASRGVDVARLKLSLFLSVSLMVAGVVSVAGPIGFVGIIVPHCCRLLVGAEHRVLAIAVLFFGGAFLVLCDIAARLFIAPAEIPVGVITALLGGPFFLWLLMRRDNGLEGLS